MPPATTNHLIEKARKTVVGIPKTIAISRRVGYRFRAAVRSVEGEAIVIGLENVEGRGPI
jgi:hypothetical protein